MMGGDGSPWNLGLGPLGYDYELRTPYHRLRSNRTVVSALALADEIASNLFVILTFSRCAQEVRG